MRIKMPLIRWLNRLNFRYYYTCPNWHISIPDYRPKYCYICGARYVKVENKLCPNCCYPVFLSKFCDKCGYKLEEDK